MSAKYWIWLQQVLGYGSDAVGRVIANYGTAERFYLATDSEKIVKCRLSKSQVKRLHNIPRKKVFGIMQDCAKHGISIITPEDTLYPERLLNIADPPAVLYVKGSRFDFNNIPTVAIVGPRKISDYGARCAYVIAETLASCGFCVVSGGALGGDSAAHKGAIDSDGYTVGVLGAGIESDYLKANKDLRDDIIDHGCLISECPPFEGVSKGTFPRRNRIMSGLSNGVVVIEGRVKSGTLITAKHACDQNRDVFVIPGSPSLPQYEGSNRLISDGAKILLSINDIINEYFFLYPDKIHKPEKKTTVNDKVDEIKDIEISFIRTADSSNEELSENDESAPRASARPDKGTLSDEAVKVLEAFETIGDTFTADDAVDKTDLSSGMVIGCVTELEICGFIEALPGGRYRLK